MKRILIFGMTENPGGVESFLMNYLRRLDRERFRFDFLCNTKEKIAWEEEFPSLGADVIRITARSEDFIRYKKELENFFQKHSKEYDIIWVNVSSLANIDYLKAAKKYGIPGRIIHSHNSRNMDSALRGLLHRANRRIIGAYATDFWACSEEAADWFYEGELRKRAVIVHNAIEPGRYAFSPEERDRVRRIVRAAVDGAQGECMERRAGGDSPDGTLSGAQGDDLQTRAGGVVPYETFSDAQDEDLEQRAEEDRVVLQLCERKRCSDGLFVIGHVGRMHFQKNQKFLLEVFCEVIRRKPEARLVLIGGGEDEAEVRGIISEKKLESSVYLAGVRSDVEAWLSAFDLFIFPSLFEGMSVAALEVQANGLPVLASDAALPEEARLNRNVQVLPLSDGADRWADAVCDLIERCGSDPASARVPFEGVRGAFAGRGFEIGREVKRLEGMLSGLID